MSIDAMPDNGYYDSTAAPANEAIGQIDTDERNRAGIRGGGGKWLNTGTIILIVLAVAAAGGIAWYYFKKR